RPQAHRQAPGDQALHGGRPRPAGSHRQFVPADRRSDRDHAIAAAAVGPAGRTARRRRIDPSDRRRYRAHSQLHRIHRQRNQPMSPTRLLPAWADDLHRRYARGEASMFVLHGNVYDGIIDGQRLVTLTDFLTDVLLKDTRETITVFNVATGVRFTKRASTVSVDDLLLASGKDKLLAALERLLIQSNKA